LGVGFAGATSPSPTPPPADHPYILGHAPGAEVSEGFSYVDLTFNEEINPATFTESDVGMTGPHGPITVGPPANQGGDVWRISFNPQTTHGVSSDNYSSPSATIISPSSPKKTGSSDFFLFGSFSFFVKSCEFL
jgi:hypothetical protein